MFEKEAEEYADNQIGCGDGYYEWTDVTQAYQKGAEFGYNKANEWHYVKDGDLPKEDEYVRIYTDLNDCYIARKVVNHFISKGWRFIPMSTVIAWKEIIPPKEIKENEL